MAHNLSTAELRLEGEIRRYNAVHGALFPHIQMTTHAELVPEGVKFVHRLNSMSPRSTDQVRKTVTRGEWIDELEGLEAKAAETHEWNVTWGRWLPRLSQEPARPGEMPQ